MNQILSYAIPIFILMDFVGTIPVFISLTRSANAKERIVVAIWSSMIAGLIILLFASIGKTILDYFAIPLEAVQIGGGLLLLYIAFEMILTGQLGYEKAKDIKSVIVSPLAIPMLAGPGSMSFAMITYLGLKGMDKIYLFAAVLIAVIAGAIVLSFSSLLNRILGQEFMRGLEKVTAVIVSFIAAGMIISGIKLYFF